MLCYDMISQYACCCAGHAYSNITEGVEAARERTMGALQNVAGGVRAATEVCAGYFRLST
jgi:hypothetical protein